MGRDKPNSITYFDEQIRNASGNMIKDVTSKYRELDTTYFRDLWEEVFKGFVRQHEIFHYLVERFRTIIVEELCPNLDGLPYSPQFSWEDPDLSDTELVEEGMAEAWAGSTIQRVFASHVDQVTIDWCITKVKSHFISTGRPRGYRLGKIFEDELQGIVDGKVKPIGARTIPYSAHFCRQLIEENCPNLQISREDLQKEKVLEIYVDNLLYENIYSGIPIPFPKEFPPYSR